MLWLQLFWVSKDLGIGDDMGSCFEEHCEQTEV